MTMEERIDSRVSALEAVMEEIKSAQRAVGAQCSAEIPHSEGMTFSRGENLYACRCGKRYRKNGRGGLMEVDS